MNQTVEILFGLFGGLAIFIFGMTEMSSGLKKLAGDKMRKILKVLTGNPIVGILFGALVTALVQSSSATTVMVIGFISAGLMTLPQAIAVVMGANIGTTITSQLVAFKIGHYALPIAALGFILYFFMKNKKVKNVGQVIFSFGLLFVGLNTMSAVMQPLAYSEAFQNLILQMQSTPILGLIVGTAMTAVVQSSSASIAVLQNLASTSNPDGTALMTLTAALPFLFGSNIGTTITAIFASIGSGINAKRAALAHSIFNIVGSLVFMFLIPVLAYVVMKISPANEAADVSRQIANSHTLFNIVNTLLWLPFIGILAKLVKLVFPGEDHIIENHPLYIDDKVLGTPSIAMDLATKELARMALITEEMMEESEKAFVKNDMIAAKKVHDIEDTVDNLQNEIVEYLSKLLSTAMLTENQSRRLTGLMHVVNDIERIGDYCDNIAESAEIKNSKKLPFSEIALQEIAGAFEVVTDMVDKTIDALNNYDDTLAKQVLANEYVIDDLERDLREAHIERLNNGNCHPHSAITFVELIHSLERIGDHCNNIAEMVLSDVYSVSKNLSD